MSFINALPNSGGVVRSNFLLSDNWVTDPNEANCVISLFNGWLVDDIKNYPAGAERKMGLLISYHAWARYDNDHGNALVTSFQVMMVELLGVFWRSKDNGIWSEWRTVAS